MIECELDPVSVAHLYCSLGALQTIGHSLQWESISFANRVLALWIWLATSALISLFWIIFLFHYLDNYVVLMYFYLVTQV